MPLVVRFVWAAAAAAVLGLAVAWATVGLVVADAYGEQKAIDFQRGGAASAYDWASLTDDPFLDSLFVRVWSATGVGLFFAFTVPVWNAAPGASASLLGPARPRPLPPAAEVRARDRPFADATEPSADTGRVLESRGPHPPPKAVPAPEPKTTGRPSTPKKTQKR